VPPAMTAEALPVMIVWAPRTIALREEAQTLLTVVQTIEFGRWAPRAHWRAGFWPRLGHVKRSLLRRGLGRLERRYLGTYLAERTLPKKTSSMSSGFTLGTRSKAAVAI